MQKPAWLVLIVLPGLRTECKLHPGEVGTTAEIRRQTMTPLKRHNQPLIKVGMMHESGVRRAPLGYRTRCRLRTRSHAPLECRH